MRIHIDEISENGLRLAYDEDPVSFPALEEIAQKNECSFLEPIGVRVRLRRIGDLVEGEGHIDSRIRLTCSRCLETYIASLASEFNLTYIQKLPEADDSSRHGEIEIQGDEIGLIPFQGDEIDLREAIQEEVVMAFPMRSLCRPDCKGLCSRCGADLNRGDCGCKSTFVNPKFEVLKNLKIDKR